MTERPSDPEQSAMPEDIATLYSRAQIKGNRYWDFSASRKEVRGQFRHRAAAGTATESQPDTSPLGQPTPVTQVAQSREALQNASAPKELVSKGALSREPVSKEPGYREAVQTISMQAPLPEKPAPKPALNGRVPHVAPQRLPVPPAPATGGRWFALHSVFAPESATPAHPTSVTNLTNADRRPPVMAVLSLAGGVGKTCLVATLGRALSSLGEHLLLADTVSCGLLPFYFGSREFKPGVVRTFSPPAHPAQEKRDAPVQVLNLEAELYPGDGGDQDLLLGEILRDSHHASRVLIDVATAGREVVRRLQRLRPKLLVPILPDMSSIASLGALDVFLDRQWESGDVFYVLNQFDAASPLHQDLRAMLQQRLGDRLLPIVLSRSPAVSEALAEGMTVIDYAPGSPAAEDYWHLAGWLRSIAAPAASGYGGVRWSER